MKKIKKLISILAVITGFAIFAAEGDARWFPVQLLAGAVAFGIVAFNARKEINEN